MQPLVGSPTSLTLQPAGTAEAGRCRSRAKCAHQADAAARPPPERRLGCPSTLPVQTARQATCCMRCCSWLALLPCSTFRLAHRIPRLGPSFTGQLQTWNARSATPVPLRWKAAAAGHAWRWPAYSGWCMAEASAGLGRAGNLGNFGRNSRCHQCYGLWAVVSQPNARA